MSDRIILGQEKLAQHSNPSDSFDGTDSDSDKFKVYVSKKMDYIAPEYITEIITEVGESEPQKIEQLYKKYY